MNTKNGLTALKSLLIVLTIASAVAGFCATADAAIPTSERNALIDLYTSTSGSTWTTNTNWNGAAGTECTWYGVTCDVGETHVTRISLGNNNLVGTIPATIGNLPSLQTFYLRINQLSGTIPASIGNLTNLQYLNLAGNQLSGTIPAALWNLSNLRSLELDSNQISGSIPAALGNLTNLYDLLLGYNQLSGTIPASIGNLTLLQYLTLDNNQLGGTVPAGLGNLTNLILVHLNGNQLSGPMPSELKNLTNLQDNGSDFRQNALYTADAALKTFLDQKQMWGDWVSTQTIAPSNLVVSSVTTTSVTLGWTAIPYILDTGGYEVYYSTASGGTYTLFGTTADKSATSSTVTGLLSGNTYYFKVRTKTDSNGGNQNTVYSEYTSVVSSQTTGPNIAVTDSIAPISDLMLPFGNVTQGNTSDQTVTISNIGNMDLVIGTVASADSLAAPFSITSDNCSNQTIAPAGSCSLTVRFAPAAVGAFSDSFDIPSNDPDTPTVTMSVSGTGLSSAQNNPPSAPILVYPASGQTGLATNVEFRWKKSTDPDNDPVSYQLYVCADQTFTGCNPITVASSGSKPIVYAYSGLGTGILLIGAVFAGGIRGRGQIMFMIAILVITSMTMVACHGGGGGGGGFFLPSTANNEIKQTVSNLSPGSTFYWKVVAEDGKGGTTSSEIWSFGTK